MKKPAKPKFFPSCADSDEPRPDNFELRRVAPEAEAPAPMKNAFLEKAAEDEKNAARNIWFEAGHF